MLVILLQLITSILTYILPLAFTIKSFETSPPLKDSTFKHLLNYWMYFIVLQFFNYNIISESLRSTIQLACDGFKIWLFYGHGNIELTNAMILHKVGDLRKLEHDYIDPVLKRYTPRKIRGVSILHQHLLQLGQGGETIINVGLLSSMTSFVGVVLKTVLAKASAKPRGRKRSGTGRSRSSTMTRNVLGGSNSSQYPSPTNQISPKSYGALANHSLPVSRSISPVLQPGIRATSGTLSPPHNAIPASRRSSGAHYDGAPPYLNPQNNKAQVLEASLEALTPNSRKISTDLLNSESYGLYEGYFNDAQPPQYDYALETDPRAIDMRRMRGQDRIDRNQASLPISNDRPPALQDIHLAAHPNDAKHRYKRSD